MVYDNGTNEYVYYYITDLQGNVVSIVSRYMNVMAYYEYDAWGNVISVTNGSGTPVTGDTTIAYVNPILYRGYYYDRETSLYYLHTRYYDPAVGRFLNTDTYTTTGGFLGYNMYAYCENNPIIMVDKEGNDAVIVIDYNISTGLPFFGHIYLYIQDSSEKWYFTEFYGVLSMYTNSCYLNQSAVSVIYTFTPVVNYRLADKEDLFAIDGHIASGTDQIYLPGDYSAAAQKAKDYKDNGFGYYGFVFHNCLDYVRSLLSECGEETEGYQVAKEYNRTRVPSLFFGRAASYINEKRFKTAMAMIK